MIEITNIQNKENIFPCNNQNQQFDAKTSPKQNQKWNYQVKQCFGNNQPVKQMKDMKNEENDMKSFSDINYQYEFYYDEQFYLQMVNSQQNLSQLVMLTVTYEMRSKMVDWMLEVLGAFKSCKKLTFFRAVGIMDQFLLKTDKVVNDVFLHQVGITSMMVASKLEDEFHLDSELMSKKVAFKKFTKWQLIDTEKQILDTIQFDCNFSTIYEFFNYYHFYIARDDKNISDQGNKIIKRILYSTKFYQYESKQIALSVLIILLKKQNDLTDNQIENVTIRFEFLGIQKIHDCICELNLFLEGFEITYQYCKNCFLTK